MWGRQLLLVMLAACGDAGTMDGAIAGWSAGTPLPEPVSNNAVAAVPTSTGCTLVSALGIDPSRVASGIHRRAWSFDGTWAALPDAPGAPRIAASAVAVRGKVYLLGGYSVASNGSETSVATMDVLDLASRSWESGPALPTPIDDAVAVAWRDRWIVIVSGWSNTAPVSTVQLFDVESGAWTIATPFAGTPVFGHAGALVGDELVIVDGVKATAGAFQLAPQTWRGRLDATAPMTILWTPLAQHPGPARYRAAAGALDERIVIHGGTSDPYNFDGLSYATSTPSAPLADAIAFDPVDDSWVELATKPSATMDHRASVGCGDSAYSIGGMERGPSVSAAVWRLAR